LDGRQLSIATLLLAILWRVPRRGHLAYLPRLASLGIAVVGLIWLVERVTRVILATMNEKEELDVEPR
jgi:hypothetical protein